MNNQSATFIFQGHQVDLEKGEAAFNYRIKLQDKQLDFTEKISFPKASQHGIPKELLTSILDNLLLVLGISYWKLYCPKNIIIDPFSLTKEQAEFWNIVYTKGLGEFFYENKIDYHGLVIFPFKDNTQVSPTSIQRQDRTLLLVGGGKDSIVSGEMLKKARNQFSAFVINEHPIQNATITLLGAEKISFKRVLDPLLFVLNKQKDTYNGHIPVSAQYAFLSLFAAVLYDFKYIAASNEKSANYGNVTYLGEEINHQWSKSED